MKKILLILLLSTTLFISCKKETDAEMKFRLEQECNYYSINGEFEK